jgi:hypothetical protein
LDSLLKLTEPSGLKRREQADAKSLGFESLGFTWDLNSREKRGLVEPRGKSMSIFKLQQDQALSSLVVDPV